MTGRRINQVSISARSLVATVLCLAATACFNGGRGETNVVYGGSNRLMLVIEPNRTDTGGTHLLIDTMNGDLWRLDANSAAARWVRLADGPEDLAEVEMPEDVPSDVEEGS